MSDRIMTKEDGAYETEDPSCGWRFLTITIVPMLLFYLLVLALSNYQTRSFTKEYGLTEQVDLFSGNSMQIFNRITKRSQEDIRNTLDNDPGLYNDLSYLDKVNAELKSHYAYLIVRKGDTILYCGDSNKAAGGGHMRPAAQV